MSEEILDTGKVLFKFKCLECSNIVKVNIYEILEVGDPICCDRKMDISERCYSKI